VSSPAPRGLPLTFYSVAEPEPGPGWQGLFSSAWPTWRRLVELAGGDPLAAQMLTLYNPPPYITGCSQAVHLGADRALVRNYDYAPELFERVVLAARSPGGRWPGRATACGGWWTG
jgi:hypothetical protein